MQESTYGDRRHPNRKGRRQHLHALFERVLGGKPKTTLEQLCPMMVEAVFVRNERGFSF